MLLEAAFRRKLEEADGQARNGESSQEPERMLLIAAGGHEGGGDSRMLENAMEMGQRLSALESPLLHVFVKEFDGEGHISVVPALLAKGIRLALAKTAEERAWNV